ncbi:hypothetical protein Ae201684P_020467 [Aphanomyces euteiches]|nr:hypothetical protein Ae201684P_020467 [Aphanomyces euteiches]
MDESHGDDMPTDAVDSDDTFEDDDFSKFELPLYVTGPSGYACANAQMRQSAITHYWTELPLTDHLSDSASAKTIAQFKIRLIVQTCSTGTLHQLDSYPACLAYVTQEVDRRRIRLSKPMSKTSRQPRSSTLALPAALSARLSGKNAGTYQTLNQASWTHSSIPVLGDVDCVNGCIVGIDLLRYLGAVINLNDNTLSIDGCDELISLTRLDPASSMNHLGANVTVVAQTIIQPRSFQWVSCHTHKSLPISTSVLVEPHRSQSALLHVASALYRTTSSRTVMVEVANPSDSPIYLDQHTSLGTWMSVPDESSTSTTPPDDAKQDAPTDEPGRVLTQMGGPGVVCPVQSQANTTKEIPIDWTDSSLSKDQRELFRKTLMKFADIFVDSSKAPGRTHLVEFSIDTGDSPPIRSVPYRTSKAEGDIMEAELNQYLDLGLIRPSKSPWSSPVLMIRKPDGSIRFCIDYRKLNSVTVKDSYPMPRIDDLLDVLGRAKLFSTMDIASGYWNVPMAKDSIEKTAFTCKYGLYEWLVMPFGLCNAVPCFERLMENILIDYKWRTCLVYLDDCIVYSEDFGSHLVRLSQVLTKFREAGFKLKMSKCKWGRSSVPFLGHIVTPAGIPPNPEKIKSVLRIKTLKDASEVRAFLGLAGYFRRFVRDFSKIAAPLTLLLTEEKFTWTPACDESLEKLKRNLVSPPILAHPDFDLPFAIWVDASHIAVGAVLMQKQNGKNRVIAYASQSLSKAQKNWISKEMGISEIECWGVVWATRKFRPYIDRRHFDIYTDHEALTWLFNTGSRSGNHKLARWAMEIQGLDYTVIHKPGELNGAADGLSRLAVCPIQTLLCRFGIPDKLLTDRESNFVSELATTM